MTDPKAFLLDITANLNHGSGDYVSHCFEVYNILKQWRCDEDVCLAGLYHSIYSTEFYNVESLVTREKLKEVIGINSESLVNAYCTLPDRDITILRNYLKDKKDNFSKHLKLIAHANLLSQTKNNSDEELYKLLRCYENESETYMKHRVEIEKIIVDGKQLIIFDNMLEGHYIEAIHDWCLNANWNCTHGTSKFTYHRDERFASYLTKEDFFNGRFVDILKSVANYTGQDIYAGSYYANHYGKQSHNHRHCDSSIPNTYTALIFCNKFWDETWGGELKIYRESEKTDYVIEFKPGRVVFFDSRIEHNVLPLTPAAEKDRFSIAIKCTNNQSIDYLEQNFSSENIIEVKRDE